MALNAISIVRTLQWEKPVFESSAGECPTATYHVVASVAIQSVTLIWNLFMSDQFCISWKYHFGSIVLGFMA
jgi:hypothetical protein